MMKDELEMMDPENEHPVYVALSTFVAFIVFGGIPLLPYLLRLNGDAFGMSVWFTASALLLLGFLRATVTRRTPVRGILETLVVGGVSASVAYLVGTFFRI